MCCALGMLRRNLHFPVASTLLIRPRSAPLQHHATQPAPAARPAHPCIRKCAMMASGVAGAAWKSQRCMEYSINCHSGTPAATAPASARGGSARDACAASSTATGSHSRGTTHLQRK